MALHEKKTHGDPLVISDAQFDKVYRELHRFEDIERLEKETGMLRPALRSIWGQEIARRVRNNFHRLKARGSRLAREWESCKTFLQLAAL